MEWSGVQGEERTGRVERVIRIDAASPRHRRAEKCSETWGGRPKFSVLPGSCSLHHRLFVVAPQTIANLIYYNSFSFLDLQFPEACKLESKLQQKTPHLAHSHTRTHLQ